MHDKGPPPINYATHPRYSALTSGGAQGASTAPQPALAPPAPLTHSFNSTPLAATATNAELDSTIHSTPITQTATPTSSTADEHSVDSLDGRSIDLLDGRSVDSLAEALDNLSTNDATLHPSAAQRPHRKTKYYSVIVGKCCGVYGSWSTVQPLVIGVSGSLYTGFRTYEGALWDYHTAKQAGNVRVVREPGDEYIYGPLSRACM